MLMLLLKRLAVGEGAGQLLDLSCCPGLSPARVIWHLSTVGL